MAEIKIGPQFDLHITIYVNCYSVVKNIYIKLH